MFVCFCCCHHFVFFLNAEGLGCEPRAVSATSKESPVEDEAETTGSMRARREIDS